MSPAEPKVLTMADVADLHLETYVGEDAASVTVDVGDLRATVEALEQARAELRAREAPAQVERDRLARALEEKRLRIEALTKALGKCLDVMNAEYAMPERGLTDEMRAARKLAEETLR